MTNERFSRRRCLALALTGASSLRAAPENQIARLIEVYGHQGFHRTGTAIDRASAEWLASEVRRAGLRPSLESFTLSRVDTVTTALILGDRRIAGIPLFDAAFTNAEGISGRLGPLNSDAEIGLSETVPNAAAAGALGEARRKGQHKAIVCVTRGGRPGLCPSNADLFREPFGPPVLQVASEETAALRELAQQQSQVRLIAHVRRTPAQALNVVARIDGVRPVLPPVVVMTPRSGWYTCASERGGAIVCWLD